MTPDEIAEIQEWLLILEARDLELPEFHAMQLKVAKATHVMLDRIAALEAELLNHTLMGHAERKRREDAEAALGEVVDCNNSDPILIAREPGYRWHDVIKQAIAHFSRYKD